MIVLPAAVKPPKLVKPYGVWLGRAAAAVLIALALVQLFRIDTFVPLLDNVLPWGGKGSAFVAVMIILSEVFAIPFALRMKLSPLAHLISGALVVLAPLWWLLIDIWVYSLDINTGQIGQFINLKSTVTLLVINGLWAVLSYYTLYTLGYNRLKPGDLLRK